MSKPILGLQLYSLWREFKIDPEATLRQVPGLGYDSIELAGTYGWSADRWKELLAETGLKVVSAHVANLKTDWTEQIEFQKAVGNHRYCPTCIAEADQNVAGYREAAANMNKLATRLRSDGGELFYHNHAFEFKDLGGVNGYDILLEETDPKLVRFEIDTYWIEQAGRDAAEFVAQHADRIGIIHAKELRHSDKTDQAAGEGDINFPPIISLARQHNWPVIVEFEGGGASEPIRRSSQYLRGLLEARD